jgi:photosystem II stability/assembly factor-like uncharacterized protein
MNTKYFPLSLQTVLIFLFFLPELFSQTWQIVPNSPVTNDRFEDLWFVNLNTGWVVEYKGLDRILKTTDGGLNWTVQFSSPDSIPFRSVAFNNAMLGWAGSINGALYKTTNGGDNWTRVDSSLINPPAPGLCDMSVVGDSVFIGSGRTGGPTRIIRSTNAGLTFQSIDMSGYASWMIGNYFKSKDTGWAAGKSNIATEGSVVLYTTNGGTNWTKVYISGQQSEHIWYVLPFNSSTLYGSAQNFAPFSMFYIISTNNGQTWTRAAVNGSGGHYAEAIGFVNNMTKGWIACGNRDGMFQTTNSGTTWTFLNFGQSIHSMQVINDTIAYACGKKIYKYTRGVIGIQTQQTSVPEFHILYQNYPNPFNPVTTIHYYLKSRTHVVLQIYTANGEFISTLAEKFQNAGEYKMEWNASSLPSGVYFYSLMTDEALLSGKALLVK